MALEQTRFTVLGLNPNDVATFLVVLALSLPVLLQWSKRWIWLVGPVEMLLITLLVGTGSRGGVLALIGGCLAWAYLSWRLGAWPKSWKPWFAMGLILLLGTTAGLTAFPKGFRLGTIDLSPEASAGRRLEVWSRVPAMLAAAPNGWGQGQSAEAYAQWFEPVGEAVQLRHLLSSHLTWMVEGGWRFRWLYLFFWLAAFTLLVPSSKFTFSPWGAAAWTAFLIALFYNAAGKWWNWPLPSLWLVVALILRWKQEALPSRRCWLRAALASFILVLMPFIISDITSSALPIHASDSGNIVLIGKGDPTVAILGPDKNVLGNFYGQEIRKEWPGPRLNEGSVVIVAKPDPMAAAYLKKCHCYVVSGEDVATFDKWKAMLAPDPNSKLLLINCRIEPGDWLKEFAGVTYCRGEFYGDPYFDEWREFSAAHPVVTTKDIPLCEAYIAAWWSLLDRTAAGQEVGVNTGM